MAGETIKKMTCGALITLGLIWVFSKSADFYPVERPANAQSLTEPRLNWQRVDRDIYRTKVPGGWLIKYEHPPRSYTNGNPIDRYSGITFYADPTHAWGGTSMK